MENLIAGNLYRVIADMLLYDYIMAYSHSIERTTDNCIIRIPLSSVVMFIKKKNDLIVVWFDNQLVYISEYTECDFINAIETKVYATPK